MCVLNLSSFVFVNSAERFGLGCSANVRESLCIVRHIAPTSSSIASAFRSMKGPENNRKTHTHTHKERERERKVSLRDIYPLNSPSLHVVHCCLTLTIHPFVMLLKKVACSKPQPVVRLLECDCGLDLWEGGCVPSQQFFIVVYCHGL